MEKLYISWEEAVSGMQKIAQDIISSNFLKPEEKACIVPLIRGGLPLGTILSHLLNGLPVFPLQFQTRDYKYGHRIREVGRMRLLMNKYKNLIIVDDILDTGETMHELNIYANDLLDEDQKMIMATLCRRDNDKNRKFSGFDAEYNVFWLAPQVDWVVFPWEAESLISDYRQK